MNITNLDLQKELTLEEIQHLFSKTDELTATQADENIKLNLRVTTKVEYLGPGISNPKYTYQDIDTLIYQPTIQTLIRDLMSLGYRKHLEHAIREKEDYSNK